jgi:hypothetical protein
LCAASKARRYAGPSVLLFCFCLLSLLLCFARFAILVQVMDAKGCQPD